MGWPWRRQRTRARYRADTPTAALGTAKATKTPDPRFAICGVASVPRATPALYHSERGVADRCTSAESRGIPDPVRFAMLTSHRPAPPFPLPHLRKRRKPGLGQAAWAGVGQKRGEVQVSQFNSRCLPRDVCPNSSPSFLPILKASPCFSRSKYTMVFTSPSWVPQVPIGKFPAAKSLQVRLT